MKAAFIPALALPVRQCPSASLSSSLSTFSGTLLHIPMSRSAKPHKTSNRTTTITTTTPIAQFTFSSPFPIADPFALPALAFTTSSSASASTFFLLLPTVLRPDLPGTLLWTAGLYLGLSPRERWSTALIRLLPSIELFAWLPFFMAALLVDAVLRAGAAGNPIYAISSGLSLALYAAVFDLARNAAFVTPREEPAFKAFQQFGQRWLNASGRCHQIDIVAKIKAPNSEAPPILRRAREDSVRKFIKVAFPGAKRSPNGFYKGLSIRDSPYTPPVEEEEQEQEKEIDQQENQQEKETGK